MSKSLDILSFAVPYPPNYGGVIDVYYRLKALSEAGIGVRLHCFIYGDRRPAKALENLCEEVHYYPRTTSVWRHFSRRPYIVTSREEETLVRRLANTSGPIIFEGLHTCADIGAPELRHRQRIIRMHNVEARYYNHLASTHGGWRGWYYRVESKKIEGYEDKVLSEADMVLAISKSETEYFNDLHANVMFMPAGHPFVEVTAKSGKGDYVLLQGDLSVPHNLSILPALAPACEAAGLKLVLAGRAPRLSGRQFIGKWQNIELHTDVSHEKMMDLMSNAHIHIVDGANPAGFKLKLLSSLFTGRHVLARKQIVGPELQRVVHAFDKSVEIVDHLKRLKDIPTNQALIEERKAVLLPSFSNAENAQKLISRLNFTL